MYESGIFSLYDPAPKVRTNHPGEPRKSDEHTMRAIRVDSPGGPNKLRYVEIPQPVPGPGQILVKIHSSGVNFADIMCRRSEHPGMLAPPLIPGCEASGVVAGKGEDCQRYSEGDQVVVYSPWGGTYAEWITVPESYVLPLPDEMSFREGAAFTHTFLTAYHALLTLGKAEQGDWLLVTAAAGGVGMAIVQLAKVRGLEIIGCVGSDKKRLVLDKLGIQHQINYEKSDLTAQITSITEGSGVNLALESVGGKVFDQVLAGMAPLGRLILFGIAGRHPPSVSPFQLLEKSMTWGALNLSVLFAYSNHLIQDSWVALATLYREKKVRAHIHHNFSLQNAKTAHEILENRESTGKILLEIES